MRYQILTRVRYASTWNREYNSRTTLEQVTEFMRSTRAIEHNRLYGVDYRVVIREEEARSADALDAVMYSFPSVDEIDQNFRNPNAYTNQLNDAIVRMGDTVFRPTTYQEVTYTTLSGWEFNA